ncbi:MAG: hypothetical protein AAGI23_10275 [Bacteroidota bacterium]
MRQTKIVQLLRTFNQEERELFRHFLSSKLLPTESGRQSLIDLYDYLNTFAPDFSKADPNLHKEKAYQAIYPNKVYTDEGFRKLCSMLLAQAHHFLAVRQLLASDVETAYFKIKALESKGRDKEIERTLAQLEEALDETIVRDADYFEARYRLESMKHRQEAGRKDNHDRFDVVEDLERYIYMERIVYRCNKMNADKKPLPKECGEIPTFKGDDAITADAWTAAEELLRYLFTKELPVLEAKEAYDKLKKIVRTYPYRFSPNDLHNLNSYLENATSSLFPNAHERFLELFSSYHFKYQFDLYDSFSFGSIIFFNIGRTAIHLEQFDWLEAFIYGYEGVIDKFKGKTKDLFLSHIYEWRGALDLAEKHRGKINRSLLLINVLEYPLRMKVMQKRQKSLSNTCRNFRNFLESRLSSDKYAGYHSFFKQHLRFNETCEAIATIDPLHNRAERLNAIDAIEQTFLTDNATVLHQDWLQQQCELLLPEPLGRELAQQRAGLKEDAPMPKRRAFLSFLERYQDRLTPHQLTCNRNFVRFFELSGDELREAIISTPAVAERTYWLRCMSDSETIIK